MGTAVDVGGATTRRCLFLEIVLSSDLDGPAHAAHAANNRVLDFCSFLHVTMRHATVVCLALVAAATIHASAAVVCKPCWSGEGCTVLNACSGHGACDQSTGQCQCAPCFSGDSCENVFACNKHGVCNPRTGGCLCQPGYSGSSCNVSSVRRSCSYRPCAANPARLLLPLRFGQVCAPCFTGPLCKTPVSCSHHGACIPSTGECLCVPGYSGPECSIATHACKPCYSGPMCATLNACSGHGTCDTTGGHCVCEAGYTGAECSVSAVCKPCYSGPACSVHNSCSHHGVCNPGTGQCTCVLGYSGPTCNATSS